jgi:hypothetical protein
MFDNVGASTFRKPKELHGLYRDTFIFILRIRQKRLLFQYEGADASLNGEAKFNIEFSNAIVYVKYVVFLLAQKTAWSECKSTAKS